MAIPKGYIRIGDNEKILESDIRWQEDWGLTHPLLKVIGGQNAKTRNWLLARNKITPLRIFIRKTGYPHFDGWTAIGIDTPLLRGDRIVKIKNGDRGWYDCPANGLSVAEEDVGHTVRLDFDLTDKNTSWCAYRRGSPGIRLPRKISGYVPQPLPLP